MLSMYDNREYVISAIRAGAAGYVLKDASSKEIIAAIRAVASGGSYYSAPLTTALATGGSEPPPLTDREREILILVAGATATSASHSNSTSACARWKRTG